MNVEMAEAQLALTKAEEAYLKAKTAFRKDKSKKAAYDKTLAALVEARDEWRLNHREAGPGAASPAPLNVSLEVK